MRIRKTWLHGLTNMCCYQFTLAFSHFIRAVSWTFDRFRRLLKRRCIFSCFEYIAIGG